MANHCARLQQRRLRISGNRAQVSTWLPSVLQGCHKAKPFHECSHSSEWQSAVGADKQSSVSRQQPFAVEICCGQASLSRSLINAGFSVLAVDHVLHEPKVPGTLLDLTEAKNQQILIDLLNNRPPDYIHVGMPCGTAPQWMTWSKPFTQLKFICHHSGG